MTKKEFNNWLQDCKIDKDSKYTSLLSTDCLYNFYKEAQKEQLRLYGVVKSLPIQDLPNCTRVEVVDQKGRSYVNWQPTNKVRLSMQDDGRTAKIFID